MHLFKHPIRLLAAIMLGIGYVFVAIAAIPHLLWYEDIVLITIFVLFGLVILTEPLIGDEDVERQNIP